MEAGLIDNEFMKYWSRLSVVQKESLLSVARNFVVSPGSEMSNQELSMNLIMEDRENYLKGDGKSYNWDEVKEMALNKEKRKIDFHI